MSVYILPDTIGGYVFKDICLFLQQRVGYVTNKKQANRPKMSVEKDKTGHPTP